MSTKRRGWRLAAASVNNAPVRDTRIPGPVTARLQRAFSELVGVDVVEQYLSRLSVAADVT